MSSDSSCRACPLVGKCQTGSLTNERIRSCANCITSYLSQYDGYVAEDQLLLALDKLRFFSVLGKMHLSMLADKDGDNYAETLDSIEVAAAKLQEFCDNIWDGIMIGCEEQGGEGESETGRSSKRAKKQPYILAKMPEWPGKAAGEAQPKSETPESNK